MAITGIICEYNPMHKGHVYHIQKAKDFSSVIVCAMSGNFVQRGEPAFVDKWSRTKVALENGADLVVEIPVYACVDSAKNYARAGVELLASLGCDCLSCGAENDESALLEKIYSASQSEAFSAVIRQEMKNGVGYPVAFASATEKILGAQYSSFVSMPNNTLALEYFSAIKEKGADIKMHLLKRIGNGYNDESLNGEFSSASAIRKAESIFDAKDALADGMLDEIIKANGKAPANIITGQKAILCALSLMTKEEMLRYIDDEDLANRLFSAVKSAQSYEQLVELTKARAFTRARVKRSILRAFLRLDAEFSHKPIPYIRVIGMNKTGANVLNDAKLPVVARFSDTKKLDEYAKHVYNLQSQTTALYGAFTEKFAFFGSDEKTKLITHFS